MRKSQRFILSVCFGSFVGAEIVTWIQNSPALGLMIIGLATGIGAIYFKD